MIPWAIPESGILRSDLRGCLQNVMLYAGSYGIVRTGFISYFLKPLRTITVGLTYTHYDYKSNIQSCLVPISACLLLAHLTDH